MIIPNTLKLKLMLPVSSSHIQNKTKTLNSGNCEQSYLKHGTTSKLNNLKIQHKSETNIKMITHVNSCNFCIRTLYKCVSIHANESSLKLKMHGFSCLIKHDFSIYFFSCKDALK